MKYTSSQVKVLQAYQDDPRVTDLTPKFMKNNKLVVECVVSDERHLMYIGKRGKVEWSRMHDVHQPSFQSEKSDSEKRLEAASDLFTVRKFMSKAQTEAVRRGFGSEEREHFYDKVRELAETVTTMPKTYEQDGKGDEAVAYLHYFMGSMDFYITERDMEDEQHQAFGLSVIHETELGYIPITELVKNGFELDFHFEPTTIGELKKKHG